MLLFWFGFFSWQCWLLITLHFEFFYCSHLLVRLQCRFASFSCDLSIAAANREVIIVQVELMWQRKSTGSMNRKIGLTYYPRDGGLTPTQWIQNQVALTAKGQISATSIFAISSKPFTNNAFSVTDSGGKQKKRLQLFIDLTSSCVEQGRKKTLVTAVLKPKCAERSEKTIQVFSRPSAYHFLAILGGRRKIQIGRYKNF